MEISQFSFSVHERLKHRHSIDLVFTKGLKFRKGVLAARVFLHAETENYDAPKIVIMVPKRLIAKAHHRNRIKRHLRESYRLHRAQFISALTAAGVQNLSGVYVAWIWNTKQISDWNLVQQDMRGLFAAIAQGLIQP